MQIKTILRFHLTLVRRVVIKTPTEAGKVTQWAQALAARPGDLISIPGTHKVEGNN